MGTLHFMRLPAMTALWGSMVLAALVAEASAEAGGGVPWPTAEEASKYVLLSTGERNKAKLVEALSGKVAMESLQLSAHAHCYVLKGAPGTALLLRYGDDRPALTPLVALRHANTGGMLLKGWAESVAIAEKPRFYRPDPKAGFRLRKNLRDVLWSEGGDIWVGEVNWVGGDVVKRRQVTQVGQFKNVDQQIGGQRASNQQNILCWSGENLFIEAGFDPKKPLVRINLNTGAVDELDWLMYEGKSIAGQVGFDPGERVAIHVLAEGIRLIDLTSGKVHKVEWGHIAKQGINVMRAGPLQDQHVLRLAQEHYWIDTDRFFLGFTTMADSPAPALAVLDLKQAKIEVTPMRPVQIDGHQVSFGGTRYEVLPGENPAVITSPSFQMTVPQNYQASKLLVDVKTGTTRVLPAPGSWADVDCYLYGVSDKGLSGNGTFMWDRTTGKDVRLAPFPESSKAQRIAGGKAIVFQKGDRMSPEAVYRVQADGSDLQQVVAKGGLLCTFDATPLDLSDGGKQLTAVTALPHFAAGGGGFVSERDRLKEALKNEPADIQKFGLTTYDRLEKNYVFGQMFKRLETALAVVETRKRLGAVHEASVLAKTEVTRDMVDPGKASKFFHQRAREMVRHDRRYTEEQKERLADEVAEHASAAFLKSPTTEIRKIDQMFLDALKAEQQALKPGTAKPAGAGTASEGAAEGRQQPAESPEGSRSEEQPSTVEETEKKVREGIKTVDKLRGLLR